MEPDELYQEFRELRKKVNAMAHAQQKCTERLSVLTPAGVDRIAERLKTINERLAEIITQQTVIEQVCLMLDHRNDPDGLRIVATLCRKAVDDKKWFKKAESMPIGDLIKLLRREAKK